MRRLARVPASRSGFAGFRFPPEAIILAVRWSLRYSRVVPRPGGAAGGSVRVVRPETPVTAAISLIHPVLADVPALNS